MEQQNPKDFSTYKDPSKSFSNRQLQAGTWYVRNRLLLKKVFYSILAFFAGITLLYSTIAWTIYLGVGIFDDTRMNQVIANSFQNYSGMQIFFRPERIQVSEVNAFSTGLGKYDFAARVVNPNERHVLEIDYKFVFDGGETEMMTQVIHPGESKFVGSFAYESLSYPSGLEFQLVDRRSRFIGKNFIDNPIDYVNAHLDFEASEFIFTPGDPGIDNVPYHSVMFDLENKSPYTYRDANFMVALFNRGQFEGVIPFTIEQFDRSSSEEIDLRFGTGIPSVTDIEVYPMMNIFDERNFVAPE